MVQLRTDVDLNLLTALDRLLETCSVTRSAEELHLSVPAMSHALGRIRSTFGDPILVRSGRSLVPTPRAEALKGPVRAIVAQTQVLLARPGPFDPASLQRTFVIRTSDALVGTVGPRLAERVSKEAPLVTIRFAPEGDRKDVECLRSDQIDLSINARVVDAPDIEQRQLFADGFVGLVRADHPLISVRVTPRRLVAHAHVGVSRRGVTRGPIDEHLAVLGLHRHVALVVPSFYAAAFAVATSELVAAVPGRLAAALCAETSLRTFKIPLKLPDYAVVVAWHRRLSEDSAHRWLRENIATWLV